MNNDCPHCYGKFSDNSDCPGCPFLESCKYYKQSARGIDRGFRQPSLDAMEDWGSLISDPAPGPGEEEMKQTEPLFGISELARFLRYLMELDSYTLEILREIIAPSSGKPCTTVDLGRLHGISRQSVHRKLLRVIFRHPELRDLLRKTLTRMPPRQMA